MKQYPKSAEWIGGVHGYLRLIDQTRLPGELVYRDCRDAETVWQSIKELAVRGAPAIGVAASYGMVLAAQQVLDEPRTLIEQLRKAGEYLKSCRPTAVNLAWAVNRQLRVVEQNADSISKSSAIAALLEEANQIRDEDARMCRQIGEHGAALMPSGGGVLTHCNAGGLATSEYGTALAAIYAAWERGKRFRVFADETRPLLQGARLTCWELQQHGIDATLICDNMAGMMMKNGEVEAVIVGADRIAANGDVANKIGTYSVAVLAKHHGIPFYVAAPSSTFDLAIASGAQIPIEERDPDEVARPYGYQAAPVGVGIRNPAFDVTPAELIAAIVTERGIIRPVSHQSVQSMVGFSQK